MLGFTIIVVTYRNPIELERTLNSIALQTYKKYSVVLVNGDPECELTKIVISKFKFLNAEIINEVDVGIYDAMNKAFRFIFHEYFIFLNSGDTFYDKFVLKYVNENTFNDLPAVVFGIANIVDIKKKSDYPSLKKGFCIEKFLKKGLPNHQAMFFNSKKCGNLRYRLDLNVSSDSVFKIEALDLGYQFIDKKFCSFYKGGISSKLTFKSIVLQSLDRIKRTDRFGGLYNGVIFFFKKNIQKILSK